MLLTHSILHSAGTKGMGFNVQQLKILGVSWPPKHGWLRSLVGKEVSDEDWQLVLKLKSVRRKPERRQIINSHAQSTLPDFQQRVSKPTPEYLHDYLCYQYPACRGDIALEALCQKIKLINNQLNCGTRL